MDKEFKVMIIVFSLIVIAGIIGVNAITGYMSKQIIIRNDRACQNLAYELSQLEPPFNKTCNCYFSTCGDNQDKKELTRSFCKCDCIENSTSVSVCIRVSK